MRRAALIVCACAVTALATHAQQKPSLADLKTTTEATGYKSTSTYDDVVKFIKTVDELNTPDITIAYFTVTPPETWLPSRSGAATAGPTRSQPITATATTAGVNGGVEFMIGSLSA